MPPRKRAEPKPKSEDTWKGPEFQHVVMDEVNEFETPKPETETSEDPDELTPEEFDARLRAGELEATQESIVSDPEPQEIEVKTLEPLEVGDLVFDDGKVRALRSLFPLTIDERKEQRLYIVEVPGEDGTLAAVWYTNTQDGPVLAIPVSRLVHYDNDSFTTDDGRSFSYSRSSGCGCGNRLKHWRPWDGWVRVVQTSRR